MGNREEFVARANSWIGTKKGSGGHKTILNDYNKACDKGRKADISTPWCAEFVGAVAQETNNVLKDGIGVPVDCSCGTGSHSMMAKAKSAGIWVESDSYKPRVGDIIIYDKVKGGSKGHVCIMGKLKIDGKYKKVLYEAQYQKTYFHVNTSLSKIKKTMPRVVIFRPKGKAVK